MVAVSPNLIQGLQQGNTMLDSMNKQTDVIQQQNARAQNAEIERGRYQMDQEKFQIEKQREKDNEALKVFELAADGYVTEAKYYADSKGIQVPPEILQNGTMAKGVALSGKFYPDDPAKAQKFTMAFLSAQGNTLQRIDQAMRIAGPATNADQRALSRAIALEKWKIDNKVGGANSGFTLSPGQIRYDGHNNIVAQAPKDPSANLAEYDKLRIEAGQKAYNSVLSNSFGAPDLDAANRARQMAIEGFDKEFSSLSGRPQAAQNYAPPPQANPNQPSVVNQRALQEFIKQARESGYSDQEIEAELQRRGYM